MSRIIREQGQTPLRRREAHAAPSQIDLMVIGEVSYADCWFGLLNAEKLLKRPIHARFVSTAEWKRKVARRSAVVARLNAGPRIFIFQSADDLRW